jgi:hypothetical protein
MTMEMMHEETHSGVSIRVYLDPEGVSICDVEPEAPVRIMRTYDRSICDNLTNPDLCLGMSARHLVILETSGWRALVMHAHGDTGETPSGRKWCAAYTGTVYGRTWRGVYAALEGRNVRKLARIRTSVIYNEPRGRAVFYAAWDQAELDAYAGCKNAQPAIKSMRQALEGEVFGFIVDEDGPDEDSCWGFLGEMGACLIEAQASADTIAAKRTASALILNA